MMEPMSRPPHICIISCQHPPDNVRVAHITTCHPADDARILYREAAGLRELGFDVTVHGPYPRSAIVAGVPIRPIHKPGRVWRILSATWRALRAARASGAGLLHFHDPELLPAAIISKMILRKHVVFDAHEDVSLFLLKDWIPKWLRGPVSAMMSGLDHFCARRLDGVVTPTRLLEDRYKGVAPRTCTFVNLPAPEFLRQRDQVWRPFEGRRNEVIHLGTLSVSRLQFLLEVADKFLRAHPDWSWTLVGMHDYVLEWFERNVTGQIRQRLHAVGKIPHMDVAERLCRAKIGINYHTLDSRQIQVAIPLKVFEYLACGLAVVTTKVPLLVELVQDCPAVVLSGESLAEYAATLESLASSERLQEHSHTARRFSEERFNCQAEARRLAALYQDILGRHQIRE